MALNTSKRDSIIARRKRVTELRLHRNWTQRQIADACGVSLATINNDLRVLNEAWLADAKLDTDTLRARQLAEIRLVKDWAWLTGREMANMRTILQAITLEAKLTGTIAPPSFSFNFNLSIMQQIVKAAEDSGMSASETYEALMNTFAAQKRRKELSDENRHGKELQMGQEIDAERHDHERR